jgi:hypothetical protein
MIRLLSLLNIWMFRIILPLLGVYLFLNRFYVYSENFRRIGKEMSVTSNTFFALFTGIIAQRQIAERNCF